MLNNEAHEFVDLLVGYVKGLYETPDVDNERIPMVARGEYQPNTRYQRGDVVSIKGLGIFQCLEETVSDPRSNSDAWMSIYVQSAIGGGVPPTFFPITYDVINVTFSGQTVFNTTTMPVYPASVMFMVNGVSYPQPAFVAAGNIITWQNMFGLSVGDQVCISYF